MNSIALNIVTVVLAVIVFAAAVVFSVRRRTHPFITAIVLLILLIPIASEACWIILGLAGSDISTAERITGVLRGVSSAEAILLDVLLMAAFVISRKWSKRNCS